jgi:hypothetical protein
MITSIKLSLFNEGCDLKINHYGFNTPTWNASAKIDSVINTSTVEIVSNQHSNQDIMYFKEGDIVSIFTPGANDTKRTRTISSISANQITFTSSHSSSAGDIIQPTTFLNAPSHHTKRAYIDRGFIYE